MQLRRLLEGIGLAPTNTMVVRGLVMHFLDYVIGIRAEAPRNEITWRVSSTQMCGCDRFRFNGHLLSLFAEPDGERSLKIRVVSDGRFRLNVRV